jgi:pantetheine-phosphate adenylyltransferase
MNRDVAVYAGTFDPVTLGHVDLVRRAAALFPRVVVCVSEEGRSTLFPAAERVAFVREAVKDLANVEVAAFRGLLVEEARRWGAAVLLRGVRGAKDLEAEMPMAVANRSLAPEIETLFLPAATGLALVSSSLVREVAALGGDASAWVPPVVAAALARRSGAGRSGPFLLGR